MTKYTSLHKCVVALFSIFIATTPAIADAGVGTKDHGHHGSAAKTGEPGDAANATRTITVKMFDNYYEPEEISVKKGETVRIVVENAGELVHELNIATAEMHKAHGPEMMMMMEHGVLEADRINWEAAKKMQASMGHGMHKDANSVLLEPGKSGEIIWKCLTSAPMEQICGIAQERISSSS